MEEIKIFITRENEQGLMVGEFYSVQEHIGAQLIGSGVAVKPNFPELVKIQSEIEWGISEYEEKIQEIKNDSRLSDLGKKEDIEALRYQFTKRLKEQEAVFNDKLEELISSSKSKTIDIGDKLTFDKFRIEQEAGGIVAQIDGMSNTDTVLSYLKSAELNREVVRQLLTHWLDIKAILNEKLPADSTLRQRIAHRTVVDSILRHLQSIAQSDIQSKASIEISMLEAIKKRGLRSEKELENAGKSAYQRLKEKGKVRGN
ncbi:hypothetical protein [Cytobacillus sp. FSL K6-0265]|uniref:hypothetical protein n=1 Tax=Cytobacillus sp. FSL K6-0265 TaxID=2921448 RepID=UPI0030F8C493